MGTAAMVDFDPWDQHVVDDPYPLFALLRSEAPVHHVVRRGYWTIARYADVHRCLRDTDTFSSDLMYGKQPVLAPTVDELAAAWEPQPRYRVPESGAPQGQAAAPFHDLVPAIF